MEIHPAILSALLDDEYEFPVFEIHCSILAGELIEEEEVFIAKLEPCKISMEVDSSTPVGLKPDYQSNTEIIGNGCALITQVQKEFDFRSKKDDDSGDTASKKDKARRKAVQKFPEEKTCQRSQELM